MSGITGLLRFDGQSVDAQDMAASLDALQAYGRDAVNIWQGPTIGLGQRLNRLTPEDAYENLPRYERDVCVVFDGRLDNREELLARLGETNRPYQPDSLLLTWAYLRWGVDCVQHLLGDFAFGIWDEAEQRLLLARDPIGARPLYYAQDHARFVFATDVRAVLAYRGIVQTLDEAVVAAYLDDGNFTLTEQTFYDAVWKLPHAHLMTVQGGQVRQSAYWQPQATHMPHLRTLDDHASNLREQIERAVMARARLAQPAAAHISGGLDSSSVAVLAARALKQREAALHTLVSWSPPYGQLYPPQQHDERPRIDAIARAEGVPLLYTGMDGATLRDFLRRDISQQSWINLAPEWRILPLLAARGVRVVFSGWGGDEGASTNAKGILAELLLRGQWLELLRDLHHLTRWRPHALRRELQRDLLPSLFPNRVATPDPDAPAGYIAPEFAQATYQAREQRVTPYAAPTLKRKRSVQAAQHVRMMRGHVSNRMEGWAIWGAAHGITYTYPLTDQRVLAAAFAIPAQYFLQRGVRRYIYRVAMQGVLPDATLWRTSKYDAALEANRTHMRLAMWQLLAAEVAAGQWDAAVPWLDMPRLRTDLSKVPDALGKRELQTLIHLHRAIEVYHLWHYHHTG